MNAIYNTVIQELLVQQHIIRYNTKYQYDEVCAFAGLVTSASAWLQSDARRLACGSIQTMPQVNGFLSVRTC